MGISKKNYLPTQEELAEARKKGEQSLRSEPRATKAWYKSDTREIVLELNNRCTFSFFVDFAQGLKDASDDDLKEVELMPRGSALHWEKLDADLGVTNLLHGRLGSKKWMEELHKEHGIPMGIWLDTQEAMSELGRMGGSVRSTVKTLAVRENGKKGGRPRSKGGDKATA